jgi:hypothetical protein
MIPHETTCSDIRYLLRKMYISRHTIIHDVKPECRTEWTIDQSARFSRSKDFWPGLFPTNLLLYLARMQFPARSEPSIYVRGNSPLFLLTPPGEEPATIVIDQTILGTLEHYRFSSIRELAHLHANYYSPSTFNVITWLCSETFSLGSPHPHAYSKS